MRLRLLLLTAAALLSLVPALAFADDDSGDNDRAPVVLTTPVGAVPTTAAPTTVAPTGTTATADADDDRDDRGDRGPHADRADQVTDRAAWCQTHAQACAAYVAAHTDALVAWCKAHADKCSVDALQKLLDRIALCGTTPKACVLTTELVAAKDAREDARDEDKHADHPTLTPPTTTGTSHVEHPLVPTTHVTTTTTHHSPSTSELHTGEKRP